MPIVFRSGQRSKQERIHQYVGNQLNSSYGGATISSIDLNVVDAAVSGGQGVKPYSYTFTSFDYSPASVVTVASGLNDSGTLLGYAEDSMANYTFFTLTNGQYTVITPPAGILGLTVIPAINNSGQVVGSYSSDASGARTGFIGYNGQYTLIQPQGAFATYGLGINDAGQAGGYYYYFIGSQLVFRSYLYNRGTFGLISYPGYPNDTLAFSINANSDIAGIYGGSQGFYIVNGNFHRFSAGAAYYTAVAGINADEMLTGDYYKLGSGGIYSGFVYQQGIVSTVNYPGATSTVWLGINNEGVLAGYYLDIYYHIHGAIATPN
jgi:hypothetical protein